MRECFDETSVGTRVHGGEEGRNKSADRRGAASGTKVGCNRRTGALETPHSSAAPTNLRRERVRNELDGLTRRSHCNPSVTAGLRFSK
jgi:hypothetical protein